MKVTVRQKPIKGGSQLSVYLDIYPPPAGSGRTETLGVYLHANPRTPAERTHNRDMLQLAEDIRAIRHREVLDGTYRVKHPGVGRTIEAHILDEIDKRQGRTAKGWTHMLQHIRATGLLDMTLDKLDHRAMQRAQDYFLRLVAKGDLGAMSARTYWQHFRTAIRSAHKSGYLLEDFTLRTGTIKAQSAVRRALTIDELSAMARTKIKRERVWVIGMFSALTGLRSSDIRALEWSNVFDTPSGPELRFISVKTSKFEVLPLSDQARVLIGDCCLPDGSLRAGKVWPYIPATSSVNEWIRTWATAAGVDPTGLTLHSMRHTYATLQLAAGTDIYTVSKMLGHSSVTVTQIYAKLIDRSKRDAANRLVLPMPESDQATPLSAIAKI
jgi:integrase